MTMSCFAARSVTSGRPICGSFSEFEPTLGANATMAMRRPFATKLATVPSRPEWWIPAASSAAFLAEVARVIIGETQDVETGQLEIGGVTRRRAEQEADLLVLAHLDRLAAIL